MVTVLAISVAVTNGLASGLMGNVSGVVYANLFGRKHLGTIVGVSKVGFASGVVWCGAAPGREGWGLGCR